MWRCWRSGSRRRRCSTINRTGGAAAPGQALQLWVVEDDAPVSLGMLPDGPLARVAVPREIAARLGPGSALAVSEEPPGGSPTPDQGGGRGSDQRAVTAPVPPRQAARLSASPRRSAG